MKSRSVNTDPGSWIDVIPINKMVEFDTASWGLLLVFLSMLGIKHCNFEWLRRLILRTWSYYLSRPRVTCTSVIKSHDLNPSPIDKLFLNDSISLVWFHSLFICESLEKILNTTSWPPYRLLMFSQGTEFHLPLASYRTPRIGGFSEKSISNLSDPSIVSVLLLWNQRQTLKVGWNI